MSQSFLLQTDLLKDVRRRFAVVFAGVGALAAVTLVAGLTAQSLVESNRNIWGHAREIRSMISTAFRLGEPIRPSDHAQLARYRLQHNDATRDAINYILVVDSSGRIVLSSRDAWRQILISDPLLARTESSDSQFLAIRDCFAAQVRSRLKTCFRDYGGFYLPFDQSYTVALPVSTSTVRDRGLKREEFLAVINFDPSIESAGFASEFLLTVAVSCLFVGATLLTLGFFLYRNLLPTVRVFAEVDDLTGLLNRKAGLNLAIRLLAQAEKEQLPVALAIMDLDSFKSLNDTYGHQCGDHVLREASLALAESLHGTDLLARLGGEEFLVVAQCSSAHALIMMERMRSQVELLMPTWEDRSLAVTVSIGLASSEQLGYNLDHLIAQADSALYRAKGTGRNRVCSSSGSQGSNVDDSYDAWSPGLAWMSSFSRSSAQDLPADR